MAIDINKLAEVGTMAAGGGYAQAALGGAQALYGLSQLPKAKAEFERAKAAAPSLETPAQFYENYKNAYDGEMARMQNDAIQANLATSVQALQGAGGRALVGGLNQATAQSQAAQNSMLAQERQMRLAAGQELATAEERAVGRKEARSQQEMAYANQAYQAALGNIGSGLGSVGEGLMYGMSANKAAKQASGAEGEKGMLGKFKDKRAEKKDFNQAVDQVAEAGLSMGDTKLEAVPETDDAVFDNSFRENYEMNKIKNAAPAKEARILPAPQSPQPAIGYGLEMANTKSAMPSVTAINSLQPKAMFGTPAGATALAPNFTQPVETNPFDLRGPMNGSAIPSEYRNDQAIKQINALSKQYTQFAPALGRMTSFRNGGMMTEGAFNHNTNPIDLVQDGQKVGEATGGEYILNPEQAAAIAKQSAFAKNLFKKFERNAKKNK